MSSFLSHFVLFQIGYTTLHDRNENSTPPSSTQMSYLQMNSLRNTSGGSGGNTSGSGSNQTSIYPMLKEENTSNSGNNSTNYPSLSELSVRIKNN